MLLTSSVGGGGLGVGAEFASRPRIATPDPARPRRAPETAQARRLSAVAEVYRNHDDSVKSQLKLADGNDLQVMFGN
jgi:hypothetical protein